MRSNVHTRKYAIDGDICGLCDDWWPCPNARETGNYDLEPPRIPVKRKLKTDKPIEPTIEQTDASQAEGQPGENHKELMEMLGGIFVQQSRIYDCLMAIVPNKYRAELDDIHENGGLMASPPLLREDAWGEVSQSNETKEAE